MSRAQWPLVVSLVPFFGGLLVAAVLFATEARSKEHDKTADQAREQDEKKKLVDRGAYLATVTGCQDCHTPGYFYGASDDSRQLSGSEVGWKGPWGVSYPANLTPDPETGLGKWTDEQITTAIRTGVRPDKSVIRPPMPWQHYSKLTDDDVKAIVAYLRSIPAVKHQEPAAVPPGAKATGSFFELPPPPAWDAPRGPTTTGGAPEREMPPTRGGERR